MRVLFILLFIPILGLSQNSQKNVSRKLQIVELQKTADSINRLLNVEIDSLLENKAIYQIELEKRYQKQEKIQLARKYLIKAKRRRTTGIIVSGVTGLTAFIGFHILNAPSGNSGGFQLDFSEIYLLGAAGVVIIGQMINIPLQFSATNNIQKARELISKTNILSNQNKNLKHHQ